MASQSFIDLRVNNAEQFKESLSETANTKLYLCFGKTEPWANDALPATANTSTATKYEIWSNMIGGKRIYGSDLSHVIPRRNWEANHVYKFFDHMDEEPWADAEDGTRGCYVVNSQNAVYKCIGNNNGQNSTEEPTSYNTNSPIQTADGYIWKYLYTIQSSELLRFTTDDYIPIKTLNADNGSQQWEVQQNARFKDGSIHYIDILSTGSGYSNVQNVSVVVNGDGTTPVQAQPVLSGGGLSSISITDPGLGYTWATVQIIDRGNGTGATARAIITPPGGHGHDPIYELGARYIMIDASLRYSEDGVLPVENDYRQVTILKDPISKDTQNVATIQAFSQMLVITTSGTGEYDQDEIVYQGGSLSTASFKGRVVYYDSNTNKVYLINTVGTPMASRSLIGSESFTVRVLASVEEETLRKFSGNILYVDNILPVARSSDQIENFKITLAF